MSVQTLQITSAKQIKEIIEPIPPEKFCPYSYEYGGKRCFIGHINHALIGNASGNFDGFGARALTSKFLEEKHDVFADGAAVNNEPNINGYTEPEIKDRVMHLINDMIEAGY